ncbi:hypothetical protein BMR04_04910 [Methylococcaceae bacterium HT3]|nr:hypothetical protein BMR04_04910 [Methylococcaceae bacterium HT3]
MKLLQSRYNSQCKLFQQNLLNISEEITRTYAPHSPPHQPELVLMPVDPINLYAYWNLKDSETDIQTNPIDKQLALRIYSIPELSEHSSELQLCFDIDVHGLQNQQKVHLPIAASAYSAVIGEINADNNFSALATSDPIHVPRENPVSENNQNNLENSLQISDKFLHTVVSNDVPPEHMGHNENKQNTRQDSQTTETNIAPKANTANPPTEALILKNFNDYGYDLKVYTNNKHLESILAEAKQESDIYLNSKATKTTIKNVSGLGKLL